MMQARSLCRIGLLATLLATAPLVGGALALAQEREPSERQTLVDLAYAIGESHALRQVCQGDGDQYWRERMEQLTLTEAPDSGFDARLKQAFNSGFFARQAQFPTCGPESRKAELAAARKGEGLSRKLASSVRKVKRMGPDDPNFQNGDPDSVEENATER
jgi:uncharacterized protein (TIGR02301 family)